MTVSPNTAAVSSTGTYTFTYTAAATNPISTTGSSVTVLVPSPWTVPQFSNAADPGYVSASAGGCTLGAPSIISTRTIQIPAVCNANQSFTLTYASAVASPSPPRTDVFTTKSENGTAGGLALIASQPSVTVQEKLVFSIQPGNTSAGSAFNVTVQSQKDDGTVRGTFTGMVSLTLSGGSGNATLSGTISTAAASGSAAFTGPSINNTGTGYVLTATAPGQFPGASNSFNITPGLANKLVVTSPTTNLASGSQRTLTAEIRDANDNVVTTDNSTVVTFAKTDGSGTVTGTDPGSAAASSGIASLNVTGQTSGSVTITASSGVLTSGTTTFTVIPGAASAATHHHLDRVELSRR